MLRKKKHVYCHHASEYEIQFFDVDSMNIMWHGHYVKYLEMARCAFLDEIHYTYDVMKEKALRLAYRPVEFEICETGVVSPKNSCGAFVGGI